MQVNAEKISRFWPHTDPLSRGCVLERIVIRTNAKITRVDFEANGLILDRDDSVRTPNGVELFEPKLWETEKGGLCLPVYVEIEHEPLSNGKILECLWVWRQKNDKDFEPDSRSQMFVRRNFVKKIPKKMILSDYRTALNPEDPGDNDWILEKCPNNIFMFYQGLLAIRYSV